MTYPQPSPQLYTIPAGPAFADMLAQGLLIESGGDPAALAAYRILLPTRRACRSVRDTFLRLSEGKALLLPRLQTIGDVDEDELSLDLAASGIAQDILDLPPALSSLQRRFLLARLIMKLPAYHKAPDQAMVLAAALGRLMDQIYTENKDMADLADLVPADYAAHWQITLDFLKILSESWPDILAEKGVIDAADRRNRLLMALARHWQENPPAQPVIAAGSTGSIPATAALLKTIASMSSGRVILPGLDQDMDDHSWQTLDDTHPQAGLRRLLSVIDIPREAVRQWQSDQSRIAHPQQELVHKGRRWIASEMMRPSATAHKWTDLNQTIPMPIKDHLDIILGNIQRYDCSTEREEARLIALMLREALETPGRRAALITPDRRLARRVAMACQRWGIDIDDSAGQNLDETVTGSFIRLSAAACIEKLRPAALLSLLRHKFSYAPRDMLAKLETAFLRGPAPPAGLAGLRHKIGIDDEKAGSENHKNIQKNKLCAFLDDLQPRLEPFCHLCDGQSYPFHTLLDNHISTLEALARPDILWRGDDGDEAARFLATLYDHAGLMPAMNAGQYLATLEELMRSIAVRPSYGTHPRLSILGQLEARLIQADLVILGGLNEKTWPPEASIDPWMSRPMRQKFGLPSPEKTIGLAAHDFVQAFCNSEIIMTRSERVDGSPAVPSRWLQRLDTVLTALDIAPRTLTRPYYFNHAALLDMPDGPPAPFTRPEPRPPADQRPDRLSVTAIERWMRDPYSIYARYILRLYPLDDLEAEADAADRGTILHEALEQFIKRYPDKLPDQAEEELLAIGRAILEKHGTNERLHNFWWPRFEKLASWFIDHERQWRLTYKPAQTEIKGAVSLPCQKAAGFTLTAKADRIDLNEHGQAAIIDYKTGGTPTKTDIENGFSPQMPLEALLMTEGGFPSFKPSSVSYLGFWQMNGTQSGGNEQALKLDIDSLTETARTGIIKLADIFADENIPYYSLPRPDKAPPVHWQDYAHLARVQEWTALGDNSEDGA